MEIFFKDGSLSIKSVKPDKPAAKGGLLPNDQIISINGGAKFTSKVLSVAHKSIPGYLIFFLAAQAEFDTLFKDFKPGDEISIQYIRDG